MQFQSIQASKKQWSKTVLNKYWRSPPPKFKQNDSILNCPIGLAIKFNLPISY